MTPPRATHTYPEPNRTAEALAALIQALKPEEVASVLRSLLRFDIESAGVMARYALAFVSNDRPTISYLYWRYRDAIVRENASRPNSDDHPLPILSKFIFKCTIDSLQPSFVFAGRYGDEAAQRYLRELRVLRHGSRGQLHSPRRLGCSK